MEIAKGEYHVQWRNSGTKTTMYFDGDQWWIGSQIYTMAEFRQQLLLGPPIVRPDDKEFKPIEEETTKEK